MNPHHTAFIDLVNQRDLFYLYVFLAVATAVLLFRLFKLTRRLFRLALAAAVIIILGAITWGLWQFQPPGV